MEITENTSKWAKSPIFGEEYLVSDCGDVYSIRSNRLLKPNIDKSGYLYFVLCVGGVRRTVKAHRLVCEAFIENRLNKPTVNHKNGIRTDNRVENLEWATWKEQKSDPLTKKNMDAVYASTDYRSMGEKRNFGRIPVTIVWEGGESQDFPSLLAASKAVGKNYAKMSEVLSGKRRQYADFCIAVTKKHFGGEDEEKE